MSGTDYTQTPNLGLYKPLYNADAEQWGFHLNSNADVLDTMVGSSVNVLAFGADPTGQADSSDAINQAASQMGPNGRRKTVYLPTGNYVVKKQIRLTDGQTMRGDGEGSTYLLIFDSFDPAASSVIFCAGSTIDPGPTIRDLGFWFIQPNDLSSRSTMLPLGQGSSYTPGGTGVQYPWAIMAEPAADGNGQSGRIQINHVVIEGAWNGINADNACFWIDGLKICAFNIGIAIGGTAAAPVADWAHLSDIEFWVFGCWPGQKNIYGDGTTIAMRIGAQNGLTAQNISCFTSILVFTPDAQSGWFNFTNLNMDGGQSTIEVAGAFFLLIANLYSTAGGTASTRPCINVTNCQTIQIVNWLTFSADAPFGLLEVSGGSVSISNSFMLYYTHTTDAIGVSGGGVLRISDSTIVAAGTAEAWSNSVINQYDTGVLQVDNLYIPATAGSSGTAVKYASGGSGNSMGRVVLSPGWGVVLPPTTLPATAGPMRLTSAVSGTTAQLAISGDSTPTFGQQAKIRFFGTFPSGDSTEYLAASIRAGWEAFSWSGSYLDVLLTNTGNPGSGDDANMLQAARFDANGLTLAAGLGVQGGSLGVGSPALGGAFLTLQGAASTERAINFVTGVSSGRWKLVTTNTAAEDFSLYRFDNTGAFVGTPITVARATGIVTFSQPIVNGSDRALKTEIEPVTGALDIINQLQGVFYKHRDAERRQVGLIAQDVISPLPEVVFDVGPELDEDGKPRGGDAPNMLGVAYPNIVAVLIEAVKELAATVGGKPP